MVFNATFSSISVISVLFVEETRVPNQRKPDLLQVTDKPYRLNGIQTYNVSGDRH